MKKTNLQGKAIKEKCYNCLDRDISGTNLWCPNCGNNKQPIPNTLIIDGVEYETITHDFDKCLKDIEIPKGWRLWTVEECIKLHNKYRKKLNLEDCWFFIQQPFKFNKNYLARFDADSVRAGLNCYGNPSNTNSCRGVRFCREVKK